MMPEIQGLAVPVPPEGNALIQTVEDLQSQSGLTVGRARLAVDDTLELLADDYSGDGLLPDGGNRGNP
jgi:histidine ammonia-lyase